MSAGLPYPPRLQPKTCAKLERLFLILIVGGLVGVGIIRSQISGRTGFLTIDEALYFSNVLKRAYYGQHHFFQVLLLFYSGCLGIGTFKEVLSRGLYFPTVFSVATVIIYHRALRLILLGICPARILALLAFPTTYVIVLMSGFVIPEAPGLFLIIAAFYLLLLAYRRRSEASHSGYPFSVDSRYVFSRSTPSRRTTYILAALSVSCFVLSALTRETNLLYCFVGLYVTGLLFLGTRGMILATSATIGILVSFWRDIGPMFLGSQSGLHKLGLTLNQAAFGIYWGIGPWMLAWYLAGSLSILYMMLTTRHRIYISCFLLSCAGLMSVPLMYYLTAGTTSIQAYSSLIRFSHVLTPGLLMTVPFPVLAARASIREGVWRRMPRTLPFWGLFLLLLGTVATNVALSRRLLYWSQSNLYGPDFNGTPLVPTEKEGPMRLREELVDAKSPVLVLAYPSTEVSLFLLDISGVNVTGPPQDADSLCAELSSSPWQMVLFYVESRYRELLATNYPYAAEIVEQSGIVWSTQRSTCYQIAIEDVTDSDSS